MGTVRDDCSAATAPWVCLQAQRPRRRASWASSLASRVELCWQLTFSSDPVLLWFTCCSYHLHNHNCYLHDRESRGQRARDASSQLTHPDHLRAPLERWRPPCPPHSTPGRTACGSVTRHQGTTLSRATLSHGRR